MITSQNNDAINNDRELKKSLDDVPNDYEFVYFQPTPSYVSNVDLKTCYNSNSSGAMTKIGEVLGASNVMHTRDTCKFNAGMYEVKKKINDQKKISSLNKNAGLSYKISQGYFNDDPKYFLNATAVSSGQVTDFTSISSATNNSMAPSDAPNTTNLQSVEWFGYFIPPSSGNWTFGLTTADSGVIWVGANAEYDYNKTNSFVNNSGLHDVKYTEKISNFKKNTHYPLRIQYGHHSGNYNFQLSIKDPKGVEAGSAHLYTLMNADGTVYTPSLTYYSLIERDATSTNNGLFDCYVSDNVLKMTPGSTDGCSGTSNDSNGKFVYTSTSDWAKGQKFYTYRVDIDQHLDNLYLANKEDKTFMPVKKETTALSTDYIKYTEFYPDTSDTKTAIKLADVQSAQKLCNADATCKYFYFYTDNNNNTYCVKKSDSYIPKQFMPKQLNGNIKSSDLYIRNLNMNLTDNVHTKIPRKNVLDYTSYSNYEVLPTQFDSADKYSGLSDDLTNQLKKHSAYYENSSTLEGFDEHGYSKPNNVAQQVTKGSPNNYIDAVNDNQITPLQSIATDYTGFAQQVNNNYGKIDANLTNVKNMRTIMREAPNNKYDFNPDSLPYYNGPGGCKDSKDPTIIRACGNKATTKQDALNDDIKTIILQQNTIYILGSITAASLLILAIYLGK